MVHALDRIRAGLKEKEIVPFKEATAVLVKIMIATLLNEFKTMIYTGVSRDIKAARKKLRSRHGYDEAVLDLYGENERLDHDPRAVELIWCNDRESALEQWRDNKHAFHTKGMVSLILALGSNLKDTTKKLKLYQESRISSYDYAEMLIRSLDAEGKATSDAPSAFVRNGDAILSFDLGRRAIVSSHPDPLVAASKLKKELAKQLDSMMVQYLPYSRPSGRGITHHYPHWTRYLLFGGVSSHPYNEDEHDGPMDPNIIRQVARRNAEAVAQATEASDSRAAWSLKELTPNDLPSLCNHTTRPTDWTSFMERPAQKTDSWGSKAYRQAYENYRPTKPVHQLGMLVGAIVGFQIPNQFYDRSNSEAIKKTLEFNSSDDLRLYLRDKVKWVTRSTVKGSTDYVSWVISWMTAWILFCDKKSCAWASPGQLNKAYTDKFGEWGTYFFIIKH